ncbi:tyrosine-type recombinase/integrase [Gemmatimonadota bacterium]
MLTKKACDQAKFKPDGPIQQIIYEGELPGFGLRLHPTGKKSFIVRYRTRSGRQRYFTIAQYGVATVDEARKRAKKILLRVADGEDPQADKKHERAGLNVSEFCTLYIDRFAKHKKKSWQEDQRRINKHIVPTIGNRKLLEVTRGDIESMHVKIGSEGGPVEANRVLALLSKVFALAIEWGNLPDGYRNPAQGIKKYPEQSRKRFVVKEEMPHLIAAINEEPSPYVRGALLLLLLTGCRRSELLSAKWEDIDRDRQVLRLLQTKAGKEQEVPLSSSALALLEMIPHQHENPYIFPSEVGEGGHLTTLKRSWKRIREKAGMLDLTMHDLRRTVGSWLVESGASQALVGQVLRHSSLDATEIYTRTTNGAAAIALERHGEEINRISGAIDIEQPRS